MIDGSFPAEFELGLVEADPFPHQSNRSSRDLAVEDGPVESDPGDLPSVTGVDVWWVVVAEEHQNRDSVEGTNPGHRINVPARCDMSDNRARAGGIKNRPSGLGHVPFPGRATSIVGGRRLADVQSDGLQRSVRPRGSRR